MNVSQISSIGTAQDFSELRQTIDDAFTKLEELEEEGRRSGGGRLTEAQARFERPDELPNFTFCWHLLFGRGNPPPLLKRKEHPALLRGLTHPNGLDPGLRPGEQRCGGCC